MLAVLIKGNPKFINTDQARNYYQEIINFLQNLGFKVEVNAGSDYTRPRQDAALYIGHSRGAGRYEFMDEKNQLKFLRFGDPDGIIDPVDRKWQAENPPPTNQHPPKEHFIFSKQQQDAILDKVRQLGLDVSTESVLPNLKEDADRLVALAMKDEFLGPKALERHMDNLTMIQFKGKNVGFMVPFKEADGRYRAGSIYIEPEYRNKGLATTHISEWFRNRRGRAWIEPKNAASQKIFKQAGFYKTGRTQKGKSGRTFDEWVNNGMPATNGAAVWGW